jgi:predicted dehydrogenase
MTRSLRVGIVGYGFATSIFHAPLIQAVPGLDLAAVVSSDPDKVRGGLPDVEPLASAEELFARQDIDLVVIPTPNASHHPLAAKALDAGKHVVVDKPFTLDTAQARDLMARAERAGKVLSVFHNRRWDADFLTVRAVLDRGELGRLTHFESHFDRFRPSPQIRWRESGEPGSGLWYDLGSHLLDQTLCLFGAPSSISLDLQRQRDGALADDWFHAVLGYGGMRVILHASALAARPGPRFTLHGTKGSFVKHGLDPQEDALKVGGRPGDEDWGQDHHPGTVTRLEAEGLVHWTEQGLPGDYSRFYIALRDAILLDGPNPVHASDALKVIRLIELGKVSARDGKVIPVERLD